MSLKNRMLNSLSFVLTNFIIILMGVIVNYLIPLRINIADYGIYRIFILLLPYFSLLHLGLIDGVYLNFKDKDILKDNEEISSNLKGLVVIRLITSAISIILVMLFIDDKAILVTLISGIINTFILNISSYFNFISQATGNFKISNLILLITKLSFLVCLLVLFLTDKVELVNLIGINIISSSIVALYIILKFRKWINFKAKVDWPRIKKYINTGLFLMISNVLVSFILSIDKIIVNQYISPVEFSNYAFAGAIITIIYQLATSISSVMFTYISLEYFSKNNFLDKIETLLIYLTGFCLNFFILNQIIVGKYLSDYLPSVEFLNKLLPSIFMLVIIQILHSTIHKIFIRTKSYTKITMLVLFVEVISVYSIISTSVNVENVIIAVNISLVIWYVLDILSIKKMGLKGLTSYQNIISIAVIILFYRFVVKNVSLYRVFGFNLFLLIGISLYLLKNKHIIKKALAKR